MQRKLTAAVAGQGNLARLQTLRQHGCQWNPTFNVQCTAAARGGHIDIIRWQSVNSVPTAQTEFVLQQQLAVN